VDNESDNLRRILRRLPVPEPRPGFVDRALRNATRASAPLATSARQNPLRWLFTRWETWVGAALGAAAAAIVAVMVLRPVEDAGVPGITLALHEARDVDVLIDSERDLEGATIRVAVTGGVALNGFDDERELQWQTDLRRGSNLLSLPLVARSAGRAQLVAVIEHEGRTRQVTVDLTVRETEASES
jgi:hypothetical protein